MPTLSPTQISEMENFVKQYIKATNAASGSLYDPNANVTQKNVITLLGEITKPFFLQYNRQIRYDRIKKLFDKETAESYLENIKKHQIYVHDETHTLIPYCCSISLFPYLQHGSKCIGGNTEKPKHLSSFCGGLINLVNQLAAQFAGAIAIPSLLVCFDYYARNDYGENYLETHAETIAQELQFLVYYLNEPCSGRSGQSVFWNLSVFDENYLKAMYGEFRYPDEKFSSVNFKSVMDLQKFFMTWFNKERERSLLTFPVVTAAMLYDKEKKVIDKDFKEFICKEMSEGNSFFIYLSDSADSLSSCCRLQNEIKNEFSYTLGNVGEMTGSVHVITINLNRMVQDVVKTHQRANMDDILEELKTKVKKIHKYHIATRDILEEMKAGGMYSAYDANFIDMKRQYSTVGLLGIVEAAEFLGIEISPNDQYINFCSRILETISEENSRAKDHYGVLFNTEFVPGENAGHKLAQWDKKDGYVVNRECYNSYFYKVEDDSIDIIEKAKMHSYLVTRFLDGGSAVHYNLEEYMTPQQCSKWIDLNAYLGVKYFCDNVLITCCEESECGYIDKRTLTRCSKCGSENISHATRIIGFLKKIRNFSQGRQVEAGLRFYHKGGKSL